MSSEKKEKPIRKLSDIKLCEEQLTNPRYIFENFDEQEPVGSVEEFIIAIRSITDNQKRKFAYRGQTNHEWSLHSKLYRLLVANKGPTSKYPLERELLKYEQDITKYLRNNWRLDNVGHLELLAQLQHHGCPTRLLDVSLNSLVALWFATYSLNNCNTSKTDENDGRVFIFDITDRNISLDKDWGTLEIPWDKVEKNYKNKYFSNVWTTDRPFFWSPPSYNNRIPAQQAGFLVAGVPGFKPGVNSWYRKSWRIQTDDAIENNISTTWKVEEVRSMTSFHIALRRVIGNNDTRERTHSTYSFRIAAKAKQKIVNDLDKFYNINEASLFPDIAGISEVFNNKLINKFFK